MKLVVISTRVQHVKDSLYRAIDRAVPFEHISSLPGWSAKDLNTRPRLKFIHKWTLGGSKVFQAFTQDLHSSHRSSFNTSLRTSEEISSAASNSSCVSFMVTVDREVRQLSNLDWILTGPKLKLYGSELQCLHPISLLAWVMKVLSLPSPLLAITTTRFACHPHLVSTVIVSFSKSFQI